MSVDLEQLAARLRTIVDEVAVATGVVGAQVSAIVGEDRIDLAYGSANLELDTPMTVDTVMQVGSVCKVFNAALIMTLVEEGQLSLDTPIVQYLPEFKLADPEAQDTVTLRHLLSMSSGIDNGPYAEHGRGEDALGRYVASLRTVPQIFPPGQGFGYSNAGTSIAGYVAERVVGRGWDTLIKQRIFEPAGLKSALTLTEELPFYRVSVGHCKARKGSPASVVRPWYITRAQAPSGSALVMNAHDLASFARIFIEGGKAVDGRRVLSEDSVKTMMTPTTDVPVSASFVGLGQQWGLGPSMDRWDNTIVWGHGGGNRSGVSLFFWCPRQHAVLAITSNTPEAAEQFFAKILSHLSAAVFAVRPAMTVAPATHISLPNPERFVGCYERYGTRYEISEHSGQLRVKEFRLGSGKQLEQLGLIYEGALVPLGPDRFLVDTSVGPTTQTAPLVAALGFFGSDVQGRALNVATPIITARRM